MKLLSLALALGLGYAPLASEEPAPPKTYRINFSGAGKRVLFKIERAAVTIQGYDGNEVLFEIDQPKSIPPEAEGLRPVTGGGTDNTGLGLSVREEGNTLHVTSILRQEKGAEYRIRLPRNLNIFWKAAPANLDAPLRISDMQGEIEAATVFADITLQNVQGPIVAFSSSGKIKAVFSSLNQAKPSSLSSTHDAVDVTLPPDTRAIVRLNAVYGNSFTDFDLKPAPPTAAPGRGTSPGRTPDPRRSVISTVPSPARRPNDLTYQEAEQRFQSFPGFEPHPAQGSDESGDSLDGIINAPGVRLSLTSASGNIYLRKKK